MGKEGVVLREKLLAIYVVLSTVVVGEIYISAVFEGFITGVLILALKWF